MKRFYLFIAILVMMVLSACGTGDEKEEASATKEDAVWSGIEKKEVKLLLGHLVH